MIGKTEVHRFKVLDGSDGMRAPPQTWDILAIKLSAAATTMHAISAIFELEAHPIQRWAPDDFHVKAILFCGICGHEQTIPLPILPLSALSKLQGLF